MTVRTGLAENIRALRAMALATDVEYELLGEAYFSDDHLQTILDQHRTDISGEMLPAIPYGENGMTYYKNYYFQGANPEQAESGSAVWQLQDSGYNAVSTAIYSIDYNARLIRFASPTDGGLRYLTYRTYDLNAAAAEVWRLKAANVAGRFDVKSDNHDLKRSQLRTSYLAMAEHYDKLSKQSSNIGSNGGGNRMKISTRVDLR